MTTNSPTAQPHAHQWTVERPQGAYSIGTCVICAETREFSNSVEMAPRAKRRMRWNDFHSQESARPTEQD